ncbi:MAG TPA: cytochrome c biogenesis protein ResB [Verrucomicrobiae bacterium]|nr:cytochrome c biogenesis protein ResB [Verrucomicrobiae bacterium]
MGKQLFKFFSSLRLTVVCLAFGVVLVFLGTLAQVNEGLYQAQTRWFRSFFIWWGPAGAGWHLPVFPGGYLIGGILLVNLITAHIHRFQFTWKKFGIHLTHAGIILLLVGQLATDMLSRESEIRFNKGETKQYSESARGHELVFLTDAPDAADDQVVAIPPSLLKPGGEIRSDNLPFTVRIQNYYINSRLRERGPMVDTGPPPATQGIGPQAVLMPMPEDRSMDGTNIPSAVIELTGPQGSLGTWLLSPDISGGQDFMFGGKVWRVALRPQRYYLPYTIQLLSTKFDVYPGTDTPKDYQSRVRIENPQRGENREVDIYMNNPLRYQGLTFYQFQMPPIAAESERWSALEVVRNPGWLTPYAGCVMVGAGMAYQFLLHLIGFVAKRRKVQV